MEDDLDGDDLIMVKEVLKEMTGMESVEIQNVKVAFHNFLLSFKLCVSFA